VGFSERPSGILSLTLQKREEVLYVGAELHRVLPTEADVEVIALRKASRSP